jgi:hypothetical protein
MHLRLALAAAVSLYLTGCDAKPKQPTVDLTGGGKKAIERAQDVSKTLEAGAARTREAEDADGDAGAKKARD